MKRFNIKQPTLVLGVTDICSFIEKYNLYTNFKYEFGMTIKEYLEIHDYYEIAYSIFIKMFKYIDDEDLCHFVLWNEHKGEFELFKTYINLLI